MPSPCEIRVYVRSRWAISEANSVRTVVPLAATLASTVFVPVTRTEVRYRRRFDSDQAEAVSRARRIAADTGHAIRVIDLGRMNLLTRALRLAWLGRGRLPAVVINGPCIWHDLAGETEGLQTVRV